MIDKFGLLHITRNIYITSVTYTMAADELNTKCVHNYFITVS